MDPLRMLFCTMDRPAACVTKNEPYSIQVTSD